MSAPTNQSPETSMQLHKNDFLPAAYAAKFGTAMLLCLTLAACSGSDLVPVKAKKGKFDPKYGVSASVRVANKKSEFRKGGGHYKIGKPYKVAGKRYVPKDQPGYNKTGKASWYGDDFHGRLTANGEIFDMNTLTAAHPTLPLPSYARVTNLKNGRSVIVRINDRGPYAHRRIIDLSKRTAEVLDFKNDGIANVRVKYIGKARMDGQDDQYLEASYRRAGQPIGNDFKAVPKEGERRTRPTVMMASAEPPPKKPDEKKRQNFILAHLPTLGGERNSAPSPVDLANPPSSGWAPVDLVGDGYQQALDGMNGEDNPLQLAQIAPVELNYAASGSQRTVAAQDAISGILVEDTQDNNAPKDAVKHRRRPVIDIGTFQPAYAHRLALEFAAFAAVDLQLQPDGQVHLTVLNLKESVGHEDIASIQERLGLK